MSHVDLTGVLLGAKHCGNHTAAFVQDKGAIVLSREAILNAALELLEQSGIEALSMRVLASALDSRASSIYYYFSAKDRLLEAMAARIVEGVADGIDRSASRDEVIRLLARRFRSALLQHRDGGRLFAGTFPIDASVFELSDVALAAMLGAGMSERDSVDAAFNLFYLIIGSVIEQQAQQRQFDDLDQADVRDRFGALAASKYPAVQQCIEEIMDDDSQRRFERGLSFYLAGLDRPL